MAFVAENPSVCDDRHFNASHWKTRVTWLLENYGPIGERWDYHGGLFLFKNEKDKMLFVMANI